MYNVENVIHIFMIILALFTKKEMQSEKIIFFSYNNILLAFIITLLFVCFDQIFRIYNNIFGFNLILNLFI